MRRRDWRRRLGAAQAAQAAASIVIVSNAVTVEAAKPTWRRALLIRVDGASETHGPVQASKPSSSARGKLSADQRPLSWCNWRDRVH